MSPPFLFIIQNAVGHIDNAAISNGIYIEFHFVIPFIGQSGFHGKLIVQVEVPLMSVSCREGMNW